MPIGRRIADAARARAQNAVYATVVSAVDFPKSIVKPSGWKGIKLAKPNYQFEKRQKDLAKKKKQEEKRLRKLERSAAATPAPEQPPEPNATPDQEKTT